MNDLFVDIGVVIITATIGGYIATMLRQPLIPAYIVMGVVIGPLLGLVTDSATILLLSETGIVFLLFIVGLELDIRKLRDVGDVATIGGALQAGLMFAIGFLTAQGLGFDSRTAAYLGVVLSFSSTMVVVKMLSDAYELDTLHGRIAIGFLLLQDIIAILALSVLYKSGGGWGGMMVNLLLGALIIIASFFLGKIIFPPLFRNAARSLELLFLLAVSVCFFFSLIFSMLGFSVAIGAFVAGVILGNLPYNIEIISRVRPLKDFFTILFFTSIGLQASLDNVQGVLPAFLIFFLLTLVVSPLLTIIICSLFGYKKRTSFLTGLHLSQISEFALIIAFAGLAANHLSREVFNLILALTITTITASAYLIKYEKSIYKVLGGLFTAFERLSKLNRELENMSDESKHEIVLAGYDRTGYSIFRTLKRMKKDFVVVDFDPDVIRHLLERNVPCIYGDISDPEVLEKLKLHQVKLVISTIPNFHANLLLIKRVKKEHSHANIIVTSYQAEDALELYDAGADYVIIPHYLGGEHVSYLLEDITDDLDKLLTHKIEHIKELRLREETRPKKHRK